ncbi:MAG: VOC family protein [Rhodococcus sp. (in: high G+C Gram-positive bacteria)]
MRWATEQGATLADHQPQVGVRVMIDPDGHPFCLFPESS